jgi:hypothetical protein
MSKIIGIAFWSAFTPIVAGLVLLFVRKYCRPETERLLFDPVSVVWRRWRGLPPKPANHWFIGLLKGCALVVLSIAGVSIFLWLMVSLLGK